MQTNPIPGVMNTLRDAKFNEDQRMAIVTAITEMQYPLLESIEGLRSDVKSEIAGLKTDVKSENAGLSSEVKSDIAGVKSEIAGLRAEMKADVDRLSDWLGNQTLVLAGTVIASHLGVLVILKLF